MRLVLLFCALPGLLSAEEVLLPAPVAEATIFLRGAALTRVARTDLPAGAHTLLVPMLPGGTEAPLIELDGAALGAVSVRRDALVDGRALWSEAQRAAANALEAAEAARARAEDARLAATADAEGAEARLRFLRGIDGDGAEALDAEAVAATGAAVATGVAEALRARAAAGETLREAEAALEEAVRAEAQARRDRDAAGATEGPVSLLSVGLTARGGPVVLTLEERRGEAGWTPAYVADLAGATVTLERRAVLRQGLGVPLTDVALTLSTADPNARTAPSAPRPDEVTRRPPAPEAFGARVDMELQAEAVEADGLSLGAPVPEPVAPRLARAVLDGPVVTYDYPDPVTLPPGGAPVTVTLDSVALDAETTSRAVPRQDETAFLIAAVENVTGEPLLPGPVALLREGEPVGDARLPLVPAGDAAELSFGPQPHLRLEWAALENAEGEDGLFFTRGARRQEVVFRVRNLSDGPERVEALYALPFSEQEEIEVEVRAVPAPDARDVEDLRGVARWDLDVPAGGTEEVRIAVDLTWPEGETLIWEP